MAALFTARRAGSKIIFESIDPTGVDVSALPQDAWCDESDALSVSGIDGGLICHPACPRDNVVLITTLLSSYYEAYEEGYFEFEANGDLFHSAFYGRENTMCLGFNITYTPDITKTGLLFMYMSSPWAEAYPDAHDSVYGNDGEDVEYYSSPSTSLRGNARRILNSGNSAIRTDFFNLVVASGNAGCGVEDFESGQAQDYGYCHYKTEHWYRTDTVTRHYWNSFLEICEGVSKIHSIELLFSNAAAPETTGFWTGFKNCIEY